MKIYVVTGGYSYEDWFIIGVYSNKSKANEAISYHIDEDGPADWYNIEDYIVDEIRENRAR